MSAALGVKTTEHSLGDFFLLKAAMSAGSSIKALSAVLIAAVLNNDSTHCCFFHKKKEASTLPLTDFCHSTLPLTDS